MEGGDTFFVLGDDEVGGFQSAIRAERAQRAEQSNTALEIACGFPWHGEQPGELITLFFTQCAKPETSVDD
jgi:hypothetical protein